MRGRIRRLLHWWAGVDRGLYGRLEREIEDELDFHIEMRTREYVASGLEPEEARRQALRRVGELDQVRRQGQRIRRRAPRATTLARWTDNARQDVRFALRSMLSAPATTAIALLALTLAIGSTTVVFSVVDALLLDAFPYEEPDRLVNLLGPSISGETMRSFTNDLSTLERLTFYALDGHELVGPEGAREVESVTVDASFFDMLGVRPTLGRGFGPDDHAGDAPDVVMISDALWRDSFAADPGAIGATLTIDGLPQIVVGVLPAGYSVVNYGTDVLMPMRDDDPDEAIGLLRSGVTFEQGRVEAEGLATSFGLPTDRFAPLYYRSLYEMTVGGERPGLLLLAGAVALVMLIACANVANLLLARSLSRRAEISMRAALGASRGRLVRQLMVESGLLALCGGTLGVLAALWALPALRALSPWSLATGESIAIDLRVLGFALLLTFSTSVLFGLVPATLTREANLKASLVSGGGAASTSRGGRRLLDALVVTEIALALVLLIGTGLLVRTFIELRPTDPGFDTRGKLTFGVRLPERRYPDGASRARFYERIIDELGALPGVESSGATRFLPLIGAIASRRAIPEGQDPASDERPGVWLETVSANYHELMNIAILRGRALSDSPSGPPEILLSEEARRTLWPEDEPLGKRLTIVFNDEDRDFVVVGVVADTRRLHTPERRPLVWIRLRQNPDTGMSFIAQTSLPPEELAEPVRDLVRRLDPELPALNVRTMERIAYDTLKDERFYMSLIGAFGGIAILLAAIGFYGAMAYSVRQRTRELAVRVMLGASPGRIRWMVLRRGVLITAVGIGIGLAGCLALTRVVESLLFGVSPTDPITYGLFVTIVAGVGLLACYVPARRATRVDPLTALRSQ